MTKNNVVAELVQEKDESLIPSMNVNLPQAPQEQKELITDERLIGVYDEIMKEIKKDKDEVDVVLSAFVNMVLNEGDSSNSTKESLVNLLKIKSDQSDKMAKVADLMTRIKLKEKDTFPRYLAANQNNTIHIGDGNSKRALIEAINKAKVNKDPKESNQ